MQNEIDPTEAAKALSRLGAAKGGRARAEMLTGGERATIARKAAAGRWGVPKATHEGPLVIPGAPEIPSYVLEDGRRVLSLRGLAGSLGQHPSASGGALRLGSSLGGIDPNSWKLQDLAARLESPIRFRQMRGGRVAFGYEATLLADICDAVLEARKTATLPRRQRPVADRCELLVRGFARVGIIALVDEATGYQKDRERQELHKILAKYISEELLPWTKRFPNDFYDEMFRLRGWTWNSKKRPILAGQLTNQIVYERLPPGVLDGLRAKNPKDASGRRRHRHHQYLTLDIGNPHLERHLAAVIPVMRLSRNWGHFLANLERAIPRDGAQQLALFDDGEDHDRNLES
jgi:hypothetical protein